MPEERALAGSTVVVSGGAGFIGSHLVEGLLARGVARVRVLDSLRYGRRENLASGPVELVEHELGVSNPSELERVLEAADFVVHLAAEKHNQSKDAPARVLRANVEGSAQLFDAATRAGTKKIVFASSLYAHGRMAGPPMREDECPKPRTVYGVSKLAGEQLLEFFAQARGLDWLALRYFFVYGPRQYSGGGYKSVIVKTLDRSRAGEPPVVYGSGEQRLDYVFVNDVVDATCRALEAPLSGEVLNVGSGRGVSVNELVDALMSVTGEKQTPVRGAADSTEGSCRVADVTKTERLLGFRAETSLEAGLRATLDWARRVHAT